MSHINASHLFYLERRSPPWLRVNRTLCHSHRTYSLVFKRPTALCLTGIKNKASFFTVLKMAYGMALTTLITSVLPCVLNSESAQLQSSSGLVTLHLERGTLCGIRAELLLISPATNTSAFKAAFISGTESFYLTHVYPQTKCVSLYSKELECLLNTSWSGHFISIYSPFSLCSRQWLEAQGIAGGRVREPSLNVPHPSMMNPPPPHTHKAPLVFCLAAGFAKSQ